MKTDDDYAEQDRFMRMQESRNVSRERLNASTRIIMLGDSIQNISKLYWVSTLPFGISETASLRRELVSLARMAEDWVAAIDEDDRPEAA